MTTPHPNPVIEEMRNELPMRSDLAKLPLSSEPHMAQAELLMRQAVPVPLHEMLINKVRKLLKSVFHN